MMLQVLYSGLRLSMNFMTDGLILELRGKIFGIYVFFLSLPFNINCYEKGYTEKG